MTPQDVVPYLRHTPTCKKGHNQYYISGGGLVAKGVWDCTCGLAELIAALSAQPHDTAQSGER